MKNQQLNSAGLNGWGNVLTVVLLFYPSPLMAQTTDQLPENNPPIQNPKSKIQNGLPCLDSSPECVEKLTEAYGVLIDGIFLNRHRFSSFV
jgi:hypothetical protein